MTRPAVVARTRPMRAGRLPERAGELLQRFRKAQARRQVRAHPGKSASPHRRTAGDLREARDRLAGEKRRRAAERGAKEQARRAREQAAARDRHLDSLAGREEELWRQVEAAITTTGSRASEFPTSFVECAWNLDSTPADGSCSAAVRTTRTFAAILILLRSSSRTFFMSRSMPLEGFVTKSMAPNSRARSVLAAP